MTGDAYKIDLAQLDDAIAKMEKFGTSAEQTLSELDTKIAALHLEWDSAAAQAQRVAHDKWMQGASEMRENLAELKAVAQRAHTNYTATVTTNTRMWP